MPKQAVSSENAPSASPHQTQRLPDSADVTHHPFQGEIDEFVEAILADRETHLNVFDAQKTMAICLAADESARQGGRPVGLPPV